MIVGGIFVMEAGSVVLQVVEFQTARQTHLRDDADSSSFRAARLVGNEGHNEVLGVVGNLCVAGTGDAETEVSGQCKRRN